MTITLHPQPPCVVNALALGLQLKEWVVSVRFKPGTQEVPGLCVWTPVCSLVAMGKVDAVQNVKCVASQSQSFSFPGAVM